MRESATGAETDTFPKDGENVRSSKLSEDQAKRTRKCPTEKVAVVYTAVYAALAPKEQGSAPRLHAHCYLTAP